MLCGYLFQGRFGSCVLDENHLIAAVRYVELNPVRAGMRTVAREYHFRRTVLANGNDIGWDSPNKFISMLSLLLPNTNHKGG